MAVPRAGAPGGRDGGRPKAGGARGSARRQLPCAPQGAKAELPAPKRRDSRGRFAPAARRVCHPLLRPANAGCLARDHVPTRSAARSARLDDREENPHTRAG